MANLDFGHTAPQWILSFGIEAEFDCERAVVPAYGKPFHVDPSRLTLNGMLHFAPPPVFIQEEKKVPAWSLEVAQSFIKDGLLYGYPDHHRRGDPSRYELAVATHAVLYQLENRHRSSREQTRLIAKDLSNAKPETMKEDGDYMRRVFSRRNDLTRLFTEYKWELEQLGVDTKACQRNLLSLPRWVSEFRIPERGEANRGFPDVPATHWAADALTRLRRDEIVSGYPNGKWNGL